jgi:uncharacterized protein (TIGR03086 family)
MRALADAAAPTTVHDHQMDDVHVSGAEWAGQLHQLILSGRDREAAELATRHLSGDPLDTTATPRGDIGMGPLEQIDALEPLLGRVASGITVNDLDAPTPCANFTVRGVLAHMIGGATQFAAAFRGEAPPDGPADAGDGPDVVARAGNALAGLMSAIRSPGALDRTIVTPFGAMPGEAFARYVVLDGVVHGWDLATATAQPYEPSEALVAQADACAHRTIATSMRDGDTFADAVEPPAGASSIERLAAFTGRRI